MRRGETSGERGSNARGAQGPERGQAEERGHLGANERGRVEERGRVGANERGRIDERGQLQERGRAETTGRASSSTRSEFDTSNLSSEQRTRIHDVVVSRRDIPRVSNLDVDVRVNSVIPRSVRLAAVPSEVVRIFPRFRRDRVFIFNDEIVIVDPVTFRIIAVLPA
ncbi:MAG TPA: DUF1236 domain-containing protein [Xanthobacteraceae bacterium]|nr:DUF1236 domain-containing protein [Xanthobacteraceae bacterium]